MKSLENYDVGHRRIRIILPFDDKCRHDARKERANRDQIKNLIMIMSTFRDLWSRGPAEVGTGVCLSSHLTQSSDLADLVLAVQA